jgi:hypothetical protein
VFVVHDGRIRRRGEEEDEEIKLKKKNTQHVN